MNRASSPGLNKRRDEEGKMGKLNGVCSRAPGAGIGFGQQKCTSGPGPGAAALTGSPEWACGGLPSVSGRRIEYARQRLACLLTEQDIPLVMLDAGGEVGGWQPSPKQEQPGEQPAQRLQDRDQLGHA